MVCDQDTDGGGWTVVLYRDYVENVARQNFDQKAGKYINGFGTVSQQGEHWIGLETLHQLTQLPTV